MSRDEDYGSTGVAETYEDPVCGMEVSSADARYTMESGGVVYYFCSQECLDEFRAEEESAQDIELE